MWINIDLDNMRVVHKHQNKDVLRNLSWIELQCASACIACGDAVAMSKFTALELQRLYEGMTGHKLLTYANHMARVVADACMRMPETDADFASSQEQRLKVTANDTRRYRYVKGASKPEHMPDLFMPESLTAERNQDLEGNTTYAAAPTAPPRPQWQPTAADQAAAGAIAPAPAAPRQPRAPSDGTPRKGGTRDIVFSVADQMWAAAGSPREASIILKLRKEMMVELEANHGVKRTTSSNTLGDWQKARIQ